MKELNNLVNATHTTSKSSAYAKVWLYFMYFWIIFGIGTYFGQYLPDAWRRPLSIGLTVLILISLFVNRSRKFGFLISNIYAVAIGLLAYSAFTTYMQNLGPELFYKNVALAVGAFIAFGVVGYFFVQNASSIGKYLFVVLIALIVATLIGFFVQNPIFYTVINVVAVGLFLLYTLYDFNRLKRGQFAPSEMGFNLFVNLLNIIINILSLANRFRD